MENDSYPFLRPRKLQQQFNEPNPRNKSKSCTSFLAKFLLIALFLCIIPLFPSNPPDFISESIFAQSWELIHLLVIGLAVSYGLFCSRKNQQNVGLKSQVSMAKQSSVLHSSIFDCEGENPSGNLSKNVVLSQSYDFSSHRMESYVVVKNESGEKVVERSLGLPVRSLRSRVVDSDSEEECPSECGSGGESNGVVGSEKGESLEGIGGCNGVNNRWKSGSTGPGFVGENGGAESYSGKGESFMGNVGSNCVNNGWKSRSMGASFGGENGGVESYNGKDESFMGNVGSNGYQDHWRSRSMRAGFMEGESLEGNMGGNAYQDGWRSRSMSAGFVAGDSGVESSSWRGENLEGNVGSNEYQNGWRSRSVRAGFMAGDASVESYSGKCENLEGNVVSDASANVWNSWSMGAGFTVGHGSFESQFREDENLEGNVWCNASPNGWKPQSMRAGFMAEDVNVETHERKGENLEGDVVGFCSISLKPRSLRGDYLEDNDENASDLSKSQSLKSPTLGATSCGINTGFCSWLPESPNVVEGNSWMGHNYNMPYSGFPSQLNDSGFAGVSPNLETDANTTGCSSFMPSTVYPPSVTVSPTDFTSMPMRMYNHEDGNWSSSPNLVNSNLCAENSSCFMPATAPPPFMPAAAPPPFEPAAATLDSLPAGAPHPSMPAPTHKLPSSVAPSRQSKTNRFSSTKKSKLRSESNNVEFYKEGPALKTSANDVASQFNGPSVEKSEKDFMPSTPKVPSSMPNPPSNSALSGKPSRRSKLNRRLAVNKDEQRLEKDISVESSRQRDDSCAPSVDNSSLPVNDSSQKKKEGLFMPEVLSNDYTLQSNSSIQKNQGFVKPQAADLPSLSAPNTDFASSVKPPAAAKLTHRPSSKKNVEKSERESMKSYGEKGNSDNPPVDTLPSPTPAEDAATSTDASLPEKNDGKPKPMKWDENCFVLPSSQNDDVEDIIVQDEPTPEPVYCSIAVSSVDATSRHSDASDIGMSSGKTGLQQSGAQEDVQLRPSTNDSGIENFSQEIVSYKPSTPSPPLPLQIRASDIPSSVESSSRVHASGFSLNGDDDLRLALTTKAEKPLSKPPHARGFSCTSFFDRELRRSLRNEAREENRMSNEEEYVQRGGKCGCINLDVRPTLSKAALKGKSVRTIRSREVAPETDNHAGQSHQILQITHADQKHDEKQASLTENAEERKQQKQEMVVIQIGITEKRSKSNTKGRKHDKQGNAGTSIIVGVSSKEGSTGKTAVLCDVKEDEPDSEIDKKADEFIAKFKEQIRLQKFAATTDSSRRKHPQRSS